MKRILKKCISPENKFGFTFVEVVVVGVLFPIVIKNVKNYVVNTDKQNERQDIYTA